MRRKTLDFYIKTENILVFSGSSARTQAKHSTKQYTRNIHVPKIRNKRKNKTKRLLRKSYFHVSKKTSSDKQPHGIYKTKIFTIEKKNPKHGIMLVSRFFCYVTVSNVSFFALN